MNLFSLRESRYKKIAMLIRNVDAWKKGNQEIFSEKKIYLKVEKKE